MGEALSKLMSASGVQASQGSVLDRVISQPSSEDHTVLYKLADYKKGGLLLETYTKGGMMAAEKLIREEFAAYMYAGGRGRVINRAEYLRWKFRDQEQVVLPIEASLSPHDPLAKWEDHTACWQMCYRGALGESLLHVLIICDTKIHTRLARTLVKCFPKLSLDVVEGEEYLGASSLHLAIAYSNNELVQDLVEAGADVMQRAIGSFFLPRDQQRVPPARQTNYEGLAYLGEYPLAWAACCANEAVYNLLCDSGADPDAQDSFGNMILHMVVVCDKLDMFGYALRHPKVPASNGRMNLAGFTPLTLACQLGRASVFREMLELSAKEFWRYSNITCSAYPLNALDTLLPDGRTNWNSALFIILNGTKQEHLNMLDGGIIQRLLEEKWKTFARNKFLKRLLILMLHLLLLSLSVYLRHSSAEADAHPDWGLEINDARSGLRLASELGTIASTMCYIILQQGDEIKNQGLVAYFKQLIHEPAKFIFLTSNILLLACIPARLMRQTMLEEALLIFMLPGFWFLLMFFAGAVKLTGPFVTMIYSMITGDMFTFGIIYSIVLFGFSQSFYFLYKGFPNVQSTLFSSYPSTWMALFQITLGDYSYTDLSMTTYPNLSKTVFAVFMVFVPILLLNMLIAMMGNTYAHVIEQSEKEWVKQWAKIVVSLERSVAQEDAHKYLQEYSIGLGPSDDPRYEVRAVMVIKSKAKTRAKQRKGALTNWKRVGRVTIAELRRRGISGEELRRLMWGRVSISTPTKQPRRGGAAPPPDCVTGTDMSHGSMAMGQGALTGGVGEGVGPALSSALNVMAFTELELNPGLAQQHTPDLLVNGKSAPSVQTSVTPLQPSLTTPNQLNIPTTVSPYPSKTSLETKVGTTGPVMTMGAGQTMPASMQMGGTAIPSGVGPAMGVGPSMGVRPAMGVSPMAPMGVSPMAPMGVSPMIPMGVSPMTPMAVGPGVGTTLPMGVPSTMPMGVGQTMPMGVGQTLPMGVSPTIPMGVSPTISMGVGQTVPMGVGPTVPMGVSPMGVGPMLQMGVGSTLPMAAGPGVPMSIVPGMQGQYMIQTNQQMIEIQIQRPVIPDEVFRDFLFELIVLAATPEPDAAQLRTLAEGAADLDNVPEIDISVAAAAKSARRVVAGAVSGLFGVAADAPAPEAAWRRDRNENSDSDPISESVLLGRASRARRARSASKRAAPPPPHLYVPARSMYLVASESSAVESDAPWEEQPSSGNNSAKGGKKDDVARIRDARPLCIMHATRTPGPSQVEHSMLVVGSGSGVDVNSAAPAAISAHSKHAKRRPKTARTRRNRVSPTPVVDAGSPLQPWATAPLSRLSKLIRSSSASTASLNSHTSVDDSDQSTPQRY
ncbi:transient receptor potential cation channel subfamily V iav [Anticarsia gemmatalis]|uniref:transient receptor potential cation channel subfamily V iav n=1 Tax=Anticarsia gemmatalis TaxID=129554 RepID=UPI003F7636FC